MTQVETVQESSTSAPPTFDSKSATPLPLALLFTFLSSFGGGVVTTGFSFLAEAAFGFNAKQNYLLGLMQGITYIFGALWLGPLLGRRVKSCRLTSRGVLGALMLVLGGLCTLPFVTARGLPPGSQSGAWTMWVLIGGYSMLTGVLWPIIESYVSGGRSGPRLRQAIGRFNVVWSSALVAAYWFMGWLKEHYSLELIAAVGAIHASCALLLLRFSRVPAAHGSEHHHAPSHYADLLGVFRMQLITSYMVFSALTPFLPEARRVLQVPTEWGPPLAATWLATRVLAFAVLQRWQGWHGRWATAAIGAALLLVGFGACVGSTAVVGVAGLRGARISLVFGLAVFGFAMGIIYCAALYYAMAVGNADVDAGGKHEASIGLGYGAGPVCGLAAMQVLGDNTGSGYQLLMLALVSLAAITVIGLSWLKARSHHTKSSQNRPS